VKTSLTLQPKPEIPPFNVSDIGLCFYNNHFLALFEKIKFFEFPQISGMNQSVSVYLLLHETECTEMVEQTSGLSSPHQNKEKLYISICLQLLNILSSNMLNSSPQVFFVWRGGGGGGHLKTLTPIENGRESSPLHS
jgi:hypothetical protein